MEVNKLESREVLIVLFGMPMMITLIVLISIAVGHVVTARSDRPTNVSVSAATPKIDVNVPAAAPPQVQVAAAVPRFDINVPQQPAPTVNVTTPPAVVTVLDRHSGNDGETGRKAEVAKPSAPATGEPAKPARAEPVKVAPEPAKSSPDPKLPARNETPRTSETSVNKALAAETLAVKEEEMTLDTLYRYAEKYVESYCSKNSLDPVDEARKWQRKWQRGLDQAIADQIDTDEQSYINRIVVNKRECFDIEKATPEKIVEGCRIMLRYRDGHFAWLKVMRDAVTNESMKKTLVFLAAGVR